MKKTLLIAAMSLASTWLYAQTDSTSLKASKGTLSTELNVNPFNGSISLNNSLNQIKLRYFIEDNFALRFGFNVKNVRDLEDFNYPYTTTPNRSKDERKSTTLSLNFGVEKHLGKLKRLSPYIGADIALENLSSSQELVAGQTRSSINNMWYSAYYTNPSTGAISYQPQNQAYFSYGLNLFTGFDFYITKGFFFGYELALGFTQISYKKPEVNSVNNGTISNTQIVDYEKTSFNFGPKLLNGIRLGYNF